jgi:hypothetical protein
MSALVQTTPRRIRLQRSKGWRLADATNNPNGVVRVDRATRWGNPYRVVPAPTTIAACDRLAETDRFVVCDRNVAVALFEDDLTDGNLTFTVDDVRRELAGRDLACWCPIPGPCHVDVLLCIANPDIDPATWEANW